METLSNDKVSYREHLEPLLECAEVFYGSKTIKGILCVNAGFEPARWSQFVNNKKKFTGYYVYRIMKSLKLSISKYEEVAGMRFTEEQIEELKCQKFIDYNKKLIIKLRNAEKEDLKMINKALDSPDEMAVLRKLFSD